MNKLAGQLKEKIRNQEDVLTKLKHQFDIMGRLEWRKLKPVFHYEIDFYVVKFAEFLRKIKELKIGDEYFIVRRYLMNFDDYSNHFNLFKSKKEPPDGTSYSVKYYRRYGILFHVESCSGVKMLEDNCPCSNEDWEDLKKGKIEDWLNKKGGD